ncbi:MAG: ABC transporter substrate-binding protein [Deltaproteobacteria bacterium]|nr:ABC transporter substrate-binding protein [Deltaproteobacteria bacterium]
MSISGLPALSGARFIGARALRCRWLFFALIVSCAPFLFPYPAHSQTIKVGYTSKTLFFLPFFVAEKKGLYDAEGLRVELIHMGTPAVNLQALVAGQIHFSNINPDGIFIVNEKGGNLKAVAGVVNGVAYILVGGKSYRRIEDLRGTRLGVGSLKGGPTTLLIEYLRAKGLVYPRDYTMVLVSGGTPARLAALEGGSISAAVLGIPQADIALDRGFNKLGDVLEILPAFQFTTVNVDPAWAGKNRPTVVKFLKAHIRSLRWIYERPGEAADLVSKEMGIKPPYARRGVDYFTSNKLFPTDGAISLEGMKVNIEVQARDGLLSPPLPSPEKHVDPSYLRQAQNDLRN